MKKTLLVLSAAAMMSSFNVFAQASSCPDEAKNCPKAMPQCKEQCSRNTPCRPKARNQRPPRKNTHPRFSAEQKAEMELFKKTFDEYKANPTPENKAKLAELVGKKLDKIAEMNAKKAEFMRKNAERLEQMNANLKANREAEINKFIERLMNPPKRRAPEAPAEK